MSHNIDFFHYYERFYPINLFSNLDATFVTRRLMYWVEFSDEKFKFVENTKLASEFPQLVIDFLVEKVEIIQDVDSDYCMRR